MSKFFSYLLIRDSLRENIFSLSCYVHLRVHYVTKINTCIWFHKLDQILNSSVCSTSDKHPAICLLRRLKMWKKSFVTKNAERESRWIMVAGLLLEAAPFSVGIQTTWKLMFWVLLVIHDSIFWAASVMVLFLEHFHITSLLRHTDAHLHSPADK